MLVDAYTHITPPKYFETVLQTDYTPIAHQIPRMLRYHEETPHFTNFEKRMDDLNKYKIDIEVTMVHNLIDPNLFATGHELLSLTRVLNDDLADIMNRSKGRIACLGTIPLQSFHIGGKEEMQRAIRDLGLKGFMVLSHTLGKPVDQFEGMLEQAQKLDVPIYIHPIDVPQAGRPYEKEYDMMHVFGWPFESTLMLSRLVFSGMMKKYPNLKVLGHHAGAMLPFFSGRINESYEKRGASIKDFENFYYDTAIGGSLAATQCTIDVFGTSRILYATDYPWGPQGGHVRLATYPDIIRKLNISKEEQEAILWGNAMKLLKL